MGLYVNVFDFPLGDCTNKGVSSRHKTLCVTNVEGPFTPDEGHPAVKLVEGPFNTVRLVPEMHLDNNDWVMSGGNYAGTSDSRFCEAVEKLCGARFDIVKIFDRVE